MSGHENQFKSNASNKSSYKRKEKVRQKSSLTLSQIKLSVALELKAEGYENVFFDEVVEFKGRRAKAHVFCEDEDGFCLAVYCINRADLIRVDKVFEVVDIISRGGYEAALAFPLNLLNKATEVIGLTRRVFMVDQDGRVWVHYPWQGSRLIEVFKETEETLLEKDEYMPTIKGQSTQMRNPDPFYIA